MVSSRVCPKVFCETYAEYQRMVGMIHGLELVISKCSDIERKTHLPKRRGRFLTTMFEPELSRIHVK